MTPRCLLPFFAFHDQPGHNSSSCLLLLPPAHDRPLTATQHCWLPQPLMPLAPWGHAAPRPIAPAATRLHATSRDHLYHFPHCCCCVFLLLLPDPALHVDRCCHSHPLPCVLLALQRFLLLLNRPVALSLLFT